MGKIKHSKFRNTGLIFELLVRKLTSDTLSNKQSGSLDIIKEFYSKSELSKEYKIYNTLVNFKVKKGNNVYNMVDAVLNESKKINRTTLRKEKFNLIKEIKAHYELDDFFKSKVTNYNILASVYNLIEECNSEAFIDPNVMLRNKETLCEHIINQSPINENVKEDIMEEYSKEDKDIRILTYKILLEKFNTKHKDLPSNQKLVLKEYINSVSGSPKLKAYINENIIKVKTSLTEKLGKIEDKPTRIKITESLNYINEIPKNKTIRDHDVINLLQYLELDNEIKDII